VFPLSKTKKMRGQCAVSSNNGGEEDDDPELKEVMDIARAESASRGESTFMQEINAGEAKDALVAKRLVALAENHKMQKKIEKGVEDAAQKCTKKRPAQEVRVDRNKIDASDMSLS